MRVQNKRGLLFQFIKVSKSVYIAKSRQRFHITLTIFLLHVPNHALKKLYILNHGIKYNTNSSYYSSIEVRLVNSVTAIPL